MIVTTGTASGKTLAFNLPVLDALAREPKSRALYLYPTKALAQDQARTLAALEVPRRPRGDLRRRHPAERRWQMRKWANVDPDQPGHAPRRRPAAPRPLGRRAAEPPLRDRRRGARLPRRLRLARRATSCGGCGGSPASTAPSRSSCSPRRRSRTRVELAELLAGVRRDRRRRRRGAASGADDRALEPAAARRGARPASERARRGLAAAWPGSSAAACARSASRRAASAAELIHRFTADRLDAELRGRLAPYRAGYTPEQRREIERRLVEGELLGVTATDALELGIDIGLLDCAISVGFPGTVACCASSGAAPAAASTGSPSSSPARTRSTSTSCASRRRCSAAGSRRRSSTTTNPRVLDGHVRGAAFEAPLDDGDRTRPRRRRARTRAAAPGAARTPARLRLGRQDYPAARIALRSTSPDAFTVVDASTGDVLGLAERERAYSTVHEGAVYLHLGEQYLVQRARPTARARARRAVRRRLVHAGRRRRRRPPIEEPLRVERRLGLELSFGRVSVTEQVVAYQRKAVADG